MRDATVAAEDSVEDKEEEAAAVAGRSEPRSFGGACVRTPDDECGRSADSITSVLDDAGDDEDGAYAKDASEDASKDDDEEAAVVDSETACE